jgi:hypothetical protein
MPTETNQWEYRIQTFGTFFSGVKDEDLETMLNEWGTEGWEVVSARGIENTSKVTILAKRPLTTSVRRRRTLPV